MPSRSIPRARCNPWPLQRLAGDAGVLDHVDQVETVQLPRSELARGQGVDDDLAALLDAESSLTLGRAGGFRSSVRIDSQADVETCRTVVEVEIAANRGCEGAGQCKPRPPLLRKAETL